MPRARARRPRRAPSGVAPLRTMNLPHADQYGHAPRHRRRHRPRGWTATAALDGARRAPHHAARSPVRAVTRRARARILDGHTRGERRGGPDARGARMADGVRPILTLVSEGVALLSLGLVRPWGEMVPRWIALIGGRRLPPGGVTALATAGAAALTAIWTFAAVKFVSHTIAGPPGRGFLFAGGGWEALLIACYLPLLLWGPCSSFSPRPTTGAGAAPPSWTTSDDAAATATHRRAGAVRDGARHGPAVSEGSRDRLTGVWCRRGAGSRSARRRFRASAVRWSRDRRGVRPSAARRRR